MGYLIVGVGGIFGSITRYSLGKVIMQKANTTFPIGTFLINITGAILLGIVNGIGIAGNLYFLLADGFLGAYTTFSTFTVDSLNLIKSNQLLLAMVYILGTSFGSVIFAWLGVSLSRLITERKREEAEDAQLDLQGE